MSDTQRPQGLQPSRRLRPWDFPGRRTGCLCGVNSTFFSPETVQTFILSYIRRRKVLFLGNGTLGTRKHVEVAVKRTFILTLKSQKENSQTHEIQTGPAALTLIFPCSSRVGLRPLLLCKNRGSSQPRDQTQVSCVAGGFFTS